MIGPSCTIQRPVFGIFLQKPVAGKINLAGQQEMQFQPLPFFDTTHEFQIFDLEEFTFYCTRCLQVVTQIEWVSLIDMELAKARASANL